MSIVRRKANSVEAALIWEEMLTTPLGPVWLSFSALGLQALWFHQPARPPGPMWPVAPHQADPELVGRLRLWRQEAAAALRAYFDGRPDSFESLTLDLQGTPFQLQVWQALRCLPFGHLTTYQELAASLGLPRSARAVGGALRANPLPIMIPCHRVIAANGRLGGYRAGLHVKRLLLSHERVSRGKSPLPLHGRLDGP